MHWKGGVMTFSRWSTSVIKHKTQQFFLLTDRHDSVLLLIFGFGAKLHKYSNYYGEKSGKPTRERERELQLCGSWPVDFNQCQRESKIYMTALHCTAKTGFSTFSFFLSFSDGRHKPIFSCLWQVKTEIMHVSQTARMKNLNFVNML